MSFADETAAAAADILQMLANCTITVTSRVGGSIDVSTGQYAGQTVASAAGISAVRSERASEVIGASFGPIDVEEVAYAMLASSLGALAPREGLYVVDGSQTRRVTRVNRGMDGAVVELFVRSDRRP